MLGLGSGEADEDSRCSPTCSCCASVGPLQPTAMTMTSAIRGFNILLLPHLQLLYHNLTAPCGIAVFEGVSERWRQDP